MLILGIDTATLSCSVALLKGGHLLAELTLNIKKTHSERLMPLVDTMLKETGVAVKDLQAVAVAAGPGSFTGLRISVSTARALSQALKIPAVPVCTLEALAEAVPAPGALICPLLDARRQQVYSALYRRSIEAPHHLQALLEPAARPLEELIAKLKSSAESVVFVGEGLHSYEKTLKDALPAEKALFAPASHRLCRASFVAAIGLKLLKENPDRPYEKLTPLYLRQPEAERLAAKSKGGKS